MTFPSREAGSAADGRAGLRAALDDAVRKRDTVAVSALRSALSAIANAEAVRPPPAVAGASSPHVAGAVPGVGAGEAWRRALSRLGVDQIIQAEISERLRVARVLLSAAAGQPRKATERAAGQHDLLIAELRKLHEHLLGPLGAAAPPPSVDQTICDYRQMRSEWEAIFELRLSRAAEHAVIPALHP